MPHTNPRPTNPDAKPAPDRAAATVIDLEAGGRDLAAENLDLERKLAIATERLNYLELVVQEFQTSAAYKLLELARRAPGFEAARSTAKSVVGLAERAGLRPKKAATSADAEAAALPFAAVAVRASEPTPEALQRLAPRILGICHPEWRGIRAATYAQGNPVLEVPGILSPAHGARLIDFLASARVETVVINGVPPGFVDFARALHARVPALRILFVFHGSPAQHVTQPDEALMVDGLLALAREGVVARVGFLKPGLAEFFRGLGAPAVALYNRVESPARPSDPPPSDGRPHIGVFAPNMWHKNINTQLVAATMIPNAVVHVLRLPPSPYLRRAPVTFVEHGMLPHEDFVRLLGSMHANLYVTLTECFPMTVIESLAAGAPCLTAHTSGVFDDAPDLFRDLVVTAHDAPDAIAARLRDVLARREEIVTRAREHLEVVDEKARRSWDELLQP